MKSGREGLHNAQKVQSGPGHEECAKCPSECDLHNLFPSEKARRESEVVSKSTRILFRFRLFISFDSTADEHPSIGDEDSRNYEISCKNIKSRGGHQAQGSRNREGCISRYDTLHYV
jgi:hypothetical protein